MWVSCHGDILCWFLCFSSQALISLVKSSDKFQQLFIAITMKFFKLHPEKFWSVWVLQKETEGTGEVGSGME